MLMEIFAVVEKFPKNKCVVSFQAWKKRFSICMGILPLMSCNKTKGKYFHKNKDIYGKFTGKYRSFEKFSSIHGYFPCIYGNFPRMIS
jgi:hypothetical protein